MHNIFREHMNLIQYEKIYIISEISFELVREIQMALTDEFILADDLQEKSKLVGKP